MNRIYKSIFNAARRCVVCVSEATSSAQGRKGNRVVSESQSFVKPFRKTTLALLLGAMGSVAMANPLPRDVLFPIGGVNYDCSSGTSCVPIDYGGESNWTYVFSGLQQKDTLDMVATSNTLYDSLADGGTGSLTIKEGMTATIAGGTSRGVYAFDTLATNGGSAEIKNEGTLTIQGGTVFNTNGIGSNAYYSGTGTISNTGGGTLTIQGGTVSGAVGIYYNGGKSSIGTISNTGSGTLTIQGGDGAHGIYFNAYDSGIGTISNTETGTLTIQGGTGSEAYGIKTSAYSIVGNPTKGTISNTDSGTLIIQGGTGDDAYGIDTNAYGTGSTGTIQNLGSGVLTIQSASSGGIQYNAYSGGTGNIINEGDGELIIKAISSSSAIVKNASGTGSKGVIANTGKGKLIIQGSETTEGGSAIVYNAYQYGSGLISNTGEGTLIIQGGSVRNSFGIFVLSSDAEGIISNSGSGDMFIQGGTSEHAHGIDSMLQGTWSKIKSSIENTGSGNLTIKGGVDCSGISTASLGSTFHNEGDGVLTISGGDDYGYGIEFFDGEITNSGTGDLIIQGGEGQDSYGIRRNANYAEDTTLIKNLSSGNLFIKGGTGNFSYGISVNSARGKKSAIENLGSGSLIIEGGAYQNAHAINEFATGYQAKSVINNLGNGTLTIQGSQESTSYGINEFASSGAIGEIVNGINGTVNILGSLINNSFGIGILSNSESSQFLIENSGIMNLNENAFGVFFKNDPNLSSSVINKSTGTINAEAATIFEMGAVETTVNAPIPITIYTPNEGTKVAELDSYSTEQTAVISGWKLKDDWYNYSTWEDGGKLVITDVVAGSAEAQTIIDSFQDRFGTGTTIEFTGTEVKTTGLSRDGDIEKPNFTINHVNELIETGEIKNGSVVTSEVLSGKSEGSFTVSALVIGNETAGSDYINQDIGFKGIVDYYDVRVKDGYSLTLMGEQAQMAMALRTIESKPTFQLTNRPVYVEENSMLKLGVADLSATQGYFEDLAMTDASASLSVENGIFQITNVTGNGQINVQEKGQLTIANKASAGDVVNKGVLTANTVNTQIGGTASVAAMADGDQNHFETFTNEKGGEANFADVSITEGANVKNKAEGTINAGSVVLNGGAVITNFKDGTLNFDAFEMNGTLRNNGTINVGGEMSLAEGTTTTLAGKVTAGTFSIGRAAQKAQAASVATMTDPQTVAEITGETYSKVLDLAGGDVFVRKDAILAGIDLKDNIVNSKVTVDTDGTFAFSFNENQLESALKDLKLDTEGKALAVLSADLSFGETGSLTIGTTDAQETVNLGSDALVLLATDSLHGNAVLNGEGKETLNIKEGAELAFTDNAIWGNHYLVRDFVSMDAAENLTVKDLEGNVLETHYNDKGIYVTIGSTNILDKDAAFGLSNNINAIMDGKQNTLSELADICYLSMAMGAKDGVKQTNDLQHLSAQAGVLSEAYRLTDNAHESIIRHAMSDKYSNVWVEALAGKGGIDGAGTGYGDASYDSDSYGMIFGLDGRIGQSINVGAAIHYQKGDLDADSSKTHNEFKNYGASVYAGTNLGNLNVTAGITYAKGDHEFNQVNLGYVEGDTNTEVFMGGFRASYPIMLDRILITPYAGIEAVHVKEDGFKATIGGAEAFDFGSVSETFGRVPMGVKLSGSNLKFAGYADISVIPQFGNRDAKQSVSGVNTKATDVAKFDYADSVLGRVKMGAAYQVNKSTTLGVSYGASMGDVRDLSHEFSLNAKYRF